MKIFKMQLQSRQKKHKIFKKEETSLSLKVKERKKSYELLDLK